MVKRVLIVNLSLHFIPIIHGLSTCGENNYGTYIALHLKHIRHLARHLD